MKIAFAGKGGVGKTSLTAWVADWLACNGQDVWMVDADTALSLGQASGIRKENLPTPLIQRKDLIQERIHDGGFLHLNPDVGDLPESLALEVPITGTPQPGITPGRKRLLVMGAVTNAGGGCACDANALLKALLAHVIMESRHWVLVDLEAGIEHLGRGTASHVDGLVIVSEPSFRSLQTGAEIARMARDLGLDNQTLVINRHTGQTPPAIQGLPATALSIPPLPGLIERQMTDSSVLHLPEEAAINGIVQELISSLAMN
ncbi:ArsA-related P-loop ATPase [Desulfobaculum bizertense]|uniref:CO dehydrogenase maturation factor n=1 Tax=Desulfobaculum bizertense DSM 18034 TaxID=1121442 RepID=A0A1T4W494_9BACT|nr:ArsA-related P-loop ATPase [Desulfobaculum bizertense]SKA71541.1 CO dehydrogenase maturation factor [Desulfobaculum bizertense DSM 18034]